MLKRINWVHETCKTSDGYRINEDLHKNGYEVSHPQKNISYKATHSGVHSSNTSDDCLNLMAKDLARCYVEKIKAGEIKPATTTAPGKNNFISLNAAPDVENKFAQAVYRALATELNNAVEPAIKIQLEQALNKVQINNSANVTIARPTGFPSNMTIEVPPPTVAASVSNTSTISQRASENNATRSAEQSALNSATRHNPTPGASSAA